MSDDDLRLKFAQAIIKPHGKALLLNPDNSAAGWVDLSDAVSSRRSYAVDAARCIVPVDWDGSGGLLRARQFADAAAELDLRTLVATSGRPGHAHSFIRVSDPQKRESLVRIARARGGDVRRTIRPPLAPHRLGLPVSIFSPTNLEVALDVLCIAPDGTK